MPRSKGNSKSRNKKKNQKSYVKRELKLPPVVHDVPDDPTGPDLINNLNNDCLARIFQHLSFADKLKIERVCKRWRGLSKLAWENVKTLKFFEYVETCDLYQLPPKSRTNAGVGKLLKKCGSHVKKLQVDNPCDWKIMPTISEYCQNVRILGIEFDCFNWHSNIFFPQLQKVRLQYDAKGNRRFPEKALQALPPESLTDLTLRVNSSSRARGILPRTAAPIFKNFANLSKICLDGFHIESEMVSAISEKSTLISLTMRSCFLKGGLSRLTLLTNLEYLDLAEVGQVNDHFLNEISKTCPNLKHLDVDSCNFTDKGIINFWQLSELEELSMNDVEGITDAPLGNLNNLKTLYCNGCPGIRDHGVIKLMEHARNLELLTLLHTALTKKVLERANEITKVRTNDISLEIWVDKDVKDSWDEEDISPLLYF